MQPLRSSLSLAIGWAFGVVAAAVAAAPRVEPVEFTLGRFEVPGACPSVPTYAQQLTQTRALTVQAGQVDIDARVFPRQLIGDLKTRRDLRDCAVEAGRTLPGELLLNGGGLAETAVADSLKRCMAAKGNPIELVGVLLRRSSPLCH